MNYIDYKRQCSIAEVPINQSNVVILNLAYVYLFNNSDGGYSVLYENKIPVDIKYIDYDRNVKHLGAA